MSSRVAVAAVGPTDKYRQIDTHLMGMYDLELRLCEKKKKKKEVR